MERCEEYVYLFCLKVYKAVPSWLPLQRTRFMEQKIELLDFAKSFQKFYKVVSVEGRQEKEKNKDQLQLITLLLGRLWYIVLYGTVDELNSSR